MNLRDRIAGCLLGGALGDAWGGPYEGIAGPVRFEVPATARISDDTELTLATCESIIEKGAVEPDNVAIHFVRWFKADRIHGIGSSTLKAMRDLSVGTHWALAGARGGLPQGAVRLCALHHLHFSLIRVSQKNEPSSVT